MLPLGTPGDPVVLFDLVAEGSNVTIDLSLTDTGGFDTVYLVDKANVGTDCPSANGTLIQSSTTSFLVPLKSRDSVLAVCNGQDVVAKAYYVFEDFNNGVGGSNVGDVVSYIILRLVHMYFTANDF